MIDSHVHLNLRDYRKDREDVIARAVESGITGMLNIGFDPASSRETAELASRYDYIYGAVGVHPHDASEFTSGTRDEIEKLLDEPKILAVGEIGLDYYRDLSPRARQREVFKLQLDIARRKNKPAIIHCRDAFDDVLEILRESGSHRGIFHAFSGDSEMARKVLSLGFKLGVGGVITFKNSGLAKVVSGLPPEAVVLETDCPYLTPHPYRGKRNEPANLVLVANAVAKAQNADLEDVARTTDRSFAESMDIKPAGGAAVVYKIRNSLYINMTNRCTNRCVFCSREEDPVVRGYNLGLEKEPAAQDIIEAAGDVSGFDEIVFCGYGEPVVRLPELLEIARSLKNAGAKVRLNTNGLGNLFWKRNIIPEFSDLIDIISISLNTSDSGQYEEICRPVFGEASYGALIDFVQKSVQAGIKTICTAVRYPDVDIEACRKLAESLGAEFRARKYNVLG